MDRVITDKSPYRRTKVHTQARFIIIYDILEISSVGLALLAPITLLLHLIMSLHT